MPWISKRALEAREREMLTYRDGYRVAREKLEAEGFGTYSHAPEIPTEPKQYHFFGKNHWAAESEMSRAAEQAQEEVRRMTRQDERARSDRELQNTVLGIIEGLGLSEKYEGKTQAVQAFLSDMRLIAADRERVEQVAIARARLKGVVK